MGVKLNVLLPGESGFDFGAIGIGNLPSGGNGIVPVRNPLLPAGAPPPQNGGGFNLPDFLPDFIEKSIEGTVNRGALAPERQTTGVMKFLEDITGTGRFLDFGAGVGDLIVGALGGRTIEGQIGAPALFPRGGNMEPGKPIATRNGGGMSLTGAGAGRIVLRRWVANGRPFVMTSDANGKNKSIQVQRKDGSIKVYRPFRPIVIGKNLNVNSLSRLGTWMKRARKAFDKMERQVGGPAKRTKAAPKHSHDKDITVVRGG